LCNLNFALIKHGMIGMNAILNVEFSQQKFMITGFGSIFRLQQNTLRYFALLEIDGLVVDPVNTSLTKKKVKQSFLHFQNVNIVHNVHINYTFNFS